MPLVQIQNAKYYNEDHKGDKTLPKIEIELKKEVREVLVENLKRYFWNERNEELSNLGAKILLDFIVNDIGPGKFGRT